MQLDAGFVQLDDFVRGENPRIFLRSESLVPSILERGIDTALEVTPENNLLRGYRRLAALEYVREHHADRFDELFPDGIPVTVVSGATTKEIAGRHIDHGNFLQLSHSVELLMAYCMLAEHGYTQNEAANHMASLLDVIHPVKAERRNELNRIREDQGEDEYFKEYARTRRGVIQGLDYAYRCPYRVKSCLRWLATQNDDDLPENVTPEQIPALTGNNIKRLHKAFTTDLDVLDDKGRSKYSKAIPGPKFEALWAELAKKKQNEAAKRAEGEPRQKAKSGQDMKKLGDELVSDGFRMLLRHCAGDKDVELTEVRVFDLILHYAEMLKTHDPDEWEACVVRAKEIEADIVKATQEEAVNRK
jgi:hypothetical protein